MSTILPNIALTGGFADGEEGWGDDMNANLLKLSVLTQAGVLGLVDVVPANPEDGDVYILTADQTVAAFTGGAWTYIAPTEGWIFYDRANKRYVSYNGLAWVVFSSGGGGGGGGGIEEAPITGFSFVRKNGAWVSLPPEPEKEYVPLIRNATALPYFGATVINKSFTPKLGNLMVLFLACNNNYAPAPGWTDYMHSGGSAADGVGFLWRFVDQAMIDAPSISPSDRTIDTGVLFEIEAQYLGEDPLNPLAGLIKFKGNNDTTAGSLTPDAPSMIFYGACSREGGIAETNADAEPVVNGQGYGGNRTAFAALIDKAEAGVQEDLTFTITGGCCGNAFAIMAPLSEAPAEEALSDAPMDGVLYGRKDGEWAEITASEGGGDGGSGGGGAALPHKFWRLFYQYGDSRAAYGEAVAKLEMRAVAGGPDQCVGGTPLARNWFQGNVPANAFDGDPNTWWCASGEGQGSNGSTATQYSGWLGYEFPAPVTVAEVAVTARNDNGGAPQTPRDFSIEYSDDGLTWQMEFIGSADPAWNQGETKVFTRPAGSTSGGGGSGGGSVARAFLAQGVIGNGVATNWGEYTGNDGTPIPGYALTFSLDTPGTFRVTYNFAYQGSHGVRVKPRADGERIGAPILNGGWDFQTASTYESGTGWGFERSFIVELEAGDHTLDCLYNAQSATAQHILGQGFILAAEIGAEGGSGGGDGSSSIEEAPVNGLNFVRRNAAWEVLPEPPKDYVKPFRNAYALPYFGGTDIPKPFTPKLGNLMVLFAGGNNAYQPNAGWVEYGRRAGAWVDSVGFIWRFVDQAMIDAATIAPVNAFDSGVLFEIEAQYLGEDPLNPLEGVILFNANSDTSAGVYTPNVDTGYLYGAVSREGGIEKTNDDATAVPTYQRGGGNRTAFAARIDLASPDVAYDMSYAITAGGGSGNGFAIGFPLQEVGAGGGGSVDGTFVEEAPDDGQAYVRKGKAWVLLADA
jgi:hypothetical protein